MIQMGESKKHLKCEAKGCTRNRPGLAPLCVGHQLRKARYGHVHGKPLLRKEYQEELTEIRVFFGEQQDHPAIKAAQNLMNQWMDQASRNECKVSQDILKRLLHASITPHEILVEITAIWLYSRRNPLNLPDDLRLTFCLARNLGRLAGFEHRPYGPSKRQAMTHPRSVELKTFGEALRHSLARFFLNVVQALELKAQEANAAREDLRKPFI